MGRLGRRAGCTERLSTRHGTARVRGGVSACRTGPVERELAGAVESGSRAGTVHVCGLWTDWVGRRTMSAEGVPARLGVDVGDSWSPVEGLGQTDVYVDAVR